MKRAGIFLASLALFRGRNQSPQLADCSPEAFASALPPEASIERAVAVSEGGAYGEGPIDVAYPQIPTGLPELCAVTVRVRSSDVSVFRFGLFLPSRWTGRFLEVGNGGFSGGINWVDMAARTREGFAVVSTDTGHNSTSGDVTWATNDETKQDWGHRAIHGSATLGKSLVEAYYHRPISFSYYSGCSTGGRQGLREAQLHPDTFDGMLIGAPAWWTSHLQPWSLRIGALNLPADAPHHIPSQLFAVLAAEVLRQCDPADGLRDGIVSQPDMCSLDLTTIRCPGDVAGPRCLTGPQINTATKVYADYVANGVFALPGLEPSSENVWSFLLGGSSPSTYGTQYVQYMLLDDPSWDWRDYNDSIVALADARNPGRATADDYDMSPFSRRGGKIIMYHGLSDALIPTGSSTHFYKQVEAATNAASLKDWFRFFLIPGMGHCSGTSVDAPWYIRGANQDATLGTDVSTTPELDIGSDALLSLMAWVEKSAAPANIVATSWGNSTLPSLRVSRRRPLCPFPAVAKYNGTGDVNAAESWTCQ